MIRSGIRENSESQIRSEFSRIPLRQVDLLGQAMSTDEQRLNSLSVEFVEGLYADYLRDAESVSPDWRHYFEELSHAGRNGAEHAAAAFRPTFEPTPATRPASPPAP